MFKGKPIVEEDTCEKLDVHQGDIFFVSAASAFFGNLISETWWRMREKILCHGRYDMHPGKIAAVKYIC